MSDRPTRTPRDLDRVLFQLESSTGVVHGQRCRSCDSWWHPPRHTCAHCGSDRLAFEAVSGRGVVYAWTRTHRSTVSRWSERAPYVTVVVELQEGFRVVALLSGESTPRLGDPIKVDIEVESDAFVHFVATSVNTDVDATSGGD